MDKSKGLSACYVLNVFSSWVCFSPLQINEEASDKFLSHPVLSELLTEEDQKNFKSNPYFEHTKLMKSYAFKEEGATQLHKLLPLQSNGKKACEIQQKDEDMDDIHDEVLLALWKPSHPPKFYISFG
nr:NAP1-related protein 2-like isoform X2 [Ipomoea batatas]GMC75769.1 NAP1-related protein 2-like isoform X2 [Ipomoea batatas]